MSDKAFLTQVPPKAIRFADMQHATNGQKVRCLLLASADGFEVVREKLTSSTRFNPERLITERCSLRHEADNLFNAELVTLEQEGFDLLYEKCRDGQLQFPIEQVQT